MGEEDLVDVVTERLVRRDDGGLPGRGAPDARADVYLALADAAVGNAIPARLDGTDAEARAGLASDDVISRIRASWRFAHDVLTDYAVAGRLTEPDGDSSLAQATAPRRLLRAVRLRMQRQLSDALADGHLSVVWTQILLNAEDLATRDGPRWRDLPWEALLRMGDSCGALTLLGPQLLADEAAGLAGSSTSPNGSRGGR